MSPISNPAHLMKENVTLVYVNKDDETLNAYNQIVPAQGESETVKGFYQPIRTNVSMTDGATRQLDAFVIVPYRPIYDSPSMEFESVTVNGRRYQVDGEPMSHRNPSTGRMEYTKITLRRGTTG